ncbi:MAG: 50S ribosomal protein L24 [bacterium]|nr:MAG: 50S ribosomal protein L24 [bacterium]
MTGIRVKKDDVVEVITGKDRGRRGKVLTASPKTGFVVVEKINIVKKHQKPQTKMRQGGILEKENKIRIENVMVVCQKCDKAVRVGKKELKDGKRVRYCKGCGEVLDIG